MSTESNDKKETEKKVTPTPQENSNTIKDPDEWTTGSESMTGAQHSYLKTLSDEAGVPMEENLSKAAASKKIEELQQITGRGINK